MASGQDLEQDLDVLRRAWASVCAHAGVTRHELAFQLIAAAYDEPHRHYHTAHHVAECLRELAPVRSMCTQPLAAEAALLFHDYVYDPARDDNEGRSAAEAALALRAVGWPPGMIADVREMIVATSHGGAPPAGDVAFVVDVDLSIVGKQPPEFEAYERGVRREYAHVSDEAFRAGRARVLRGFLSRPRIYATDHFAARYENSARRNLGQSLAALQR